MDFFAQQDKARRGTFWLVLYFGAAVMGIVAAVYFVCLVLFAGIKTSTRHRYHLEYEPQQSQLWNPKIFTFAAGGALAVIGIGSLFKMAQLAGGGKAVAESLGGRQLSSSATDPDERKLLNVVEEMALASGVPVPPVYVMDREAGINAFAAGHNPNDAVIGVTRGCLKLLKRDELQGVIGHEFSHILNGDMRLNLRLMGIIFGIVCFTVIGREMLRVRSGGKEGNAVALLGLALIILGFVGSFFASLIQAAVSRQREFLADASAVQFTRNPAGLSSALQKIGGMAAGSQIESGHAQEASHMFFSDAIGASALSGLATHPPIEQRIRAIDPGWDGKYQRVTAPPQEDVVEAILGKPRRTAMPPIIGGAIGAAAVAGLAPQTVRVQSVLPSLGNPTPLHLRYAEALRSELPDSVREAMRHPLPAMALIYALLISRDEALRAKQLEGLAQRTDPVARETLAGLLPVVTPLAVRARLPLVELAMPALRELRPDEFQAFTQALHWLIASDRQVDLFEFVLQRIIARHLAPHFTGARPAVVQYYSLGPVIPDCTVILSALAQLNQPDQAAVVRAFSQGAPYLRTGETALPLLPREHCGLAAIDAALNRLAQAAPQIKKNLLEASIHVVGADGVVQEREAELLRAIADSLDCPIPPFVPD